MSARVYQRAESAVFCRTRDQFGLLANFASLPLKWNGIRACSSEAVYQALKFLDAHGQRPVLLAPTAYEAKTLARNSDALRFLPWEEHSITAMRFVLRLKLFCYTDLISQTLALTGDRPIVEQSGHDSFWGAIPHPANGTLIGTNALGRLWMEIRQQLRDDTLCPTTAPVLNAPLTLHR